MAAATRAQQRQQQPWASAVASSARMPWAAAVGAGVLAFLCLAPARAAAFVAPVPAATARVGQQSGDVVMAAAPGDSSSASSGISRQRGGGAVVERRNVLSTGAAAASLLALGFAPPSALALVKGNAPPADLRKPRPGGKPKAANMEDAREMGKLKEDELFAKSEGDAASYNTTPEGDRYRDIVEGSSSGSALAKGDKCAIRYRALRLGKRSRDGLSGEASTVFSYGYGEDDDKEGDVMEITLGKSNLIPALEAGLVGMRPGGKRRILVRPERGWFKGQGCGVLEDTDVNNLAATFIVPGTKITDTEDCLDMTRIPSPSSYAARRRMGRRFDESLIVEVEVVAR